MFLKDLIPLIRPESTRIKIINQNKTTVTELYQYQFAEEHRYDDCVVLSITPTANAAVVVFIQISDCLIFKEVELGANPKDYHSFELREFLIDSGVPEVDIKVKNRMISVPATKENKKLLDKWKYQFPKFTGVFFVEIDPETKIPMFEVHLN